MFTTLISTQKLAEHADDPSWVILDCRFNLEDPARCQAEYIVAHIPGAVYVHLDRDLSGPVSRGQTGRHPLPKVEEAAALFSRCGIDQDTQVVMYDAAGGASAAARAWWMLHWLGHKAAAVLDGGMQKWTAEKRPVARGVETRQARPFRPDPQPEMVVSAADVEALTGQSVSCLFDSRSAERFRGENETIDPVAGHIPGARSAPYAENLNPEGTFRSVQDLRARFQSLVGAIPAEQAIFYCGSGVTAAHNILAMAYAGLGMGRLYAGSWSEWITDTHRPISK